MLRRPSVLSILPGLLLVASPVSAVTLVVDAGGGGDFLAIQPALDAAASGDTILVLAGTYTGPDNQDLDFAGKDLVVRSDAGPDATVIDGEGSGGGFYFHTGVTAAAVVDGFTLTRLNVRRPLRIIGGDAPTIRNCIVIHNEQVSGSGGGIVIQASSPAFLECVIAENSCPVHGGGGVLIDGGTATFTDCMIVGNRAQGRGGGLLVTNGAEVTILGSTITGNRADLAQAGHRGGGLLVGGAANVSLERTIVWGNRADLGDDLYSIAGTTTNVTCSDVDSAGFMGGGSIVYGPNNIYSDPHFCQPAHCRQQPWTDGDYSLAANSPCLPANNPCGELIGAGAQGCSDAVVWTGAAGTIAWEDPLNWSTLTLPGPGDNVQLTLGSVVLSSNAQIGWLIQCPENGAVPDTFRIAAGGLLELGVGLLPSRDIQQATILNDVAVMEANSGAITADSEDPWSWNLPTGCTFFMLGGYIQGDGGLLLDGSFQYLGEGVGSIGAPFLNRGIGDGEPPTGFYVRSGTLQLENEHVNEGLTVVAEGASMQVNTLFANRPGSVMEIRGNAQLDGLLTNGGAVEVTIDATLTLAGTFDNQHEGVLSFTGNLAGGGLLANLGLVHRSGPGTSAVTAQLENSLDPTTGDRGVVRVQSGALSANTLSNSGRVAIGSGANLTVAGTFSNDGYGLLAGSGTLNVPQVSFTNLGSVSPGFSPGVLRFVGDYPTTPDSRLFIELGGTVPGVGYDQLQVTGAAQLGGALHVDLSDGFMPQPGDTFRVVTYADPALRESPFDCLSGLQLSETLCLAPVSLPGAFALVAKDSLVTNQPPVAVADTFSVPLNTPTVLTPLANDSDPEGDDLSLVSLHLASTQGQAHVDPGAVTVTYWPPEGFFGQDSLVYLVTDCRGAVDTAQVMIEVASMRVVNPEPAPSARCWLHAPAPNPFNPTIRLSYNVQRAGAVRIAVYDLCGRQVQVLAGDHHRAGAHSVVWRGIDAAGRPVASGIYFARLETPAHAETRKMTLIR